MKKEDTKAENKHISTSKSLDDEQRVKVLSPGAMVAKRFFRNRLAMVGLVILVCMFLFAFVGGALTPYKEDQVFRKTDTILKDYVGVTKNSAYRLIPMEGKKLPSSIVSALTKAADNGEESFEANSTTYYLIKEGEEFYSIAGGSQIATALALKGNYRFNESGSVPLTDEAKEAIAEAIDNDKAVAEVGDTEYQISKKGKQYMISVVENLGMATKKVFSTASSDTEMTYDFQFAAEKAIDAGETSITVDGETYQLDVDKETDSAMISKDGEEYAYVSYYVMNMIQKSDFLSLDLRREIERAVSSGETALTFASAEGKEEEYRIQVRDNQYTVKKNTETHLNDTFASPSKEHWLGTDGNGMDMMTRLMYGGRISLLIGFVVILIEIVLGMLVGGIAGYFGGWVDTILMRIVDIVICIPSMPLYLILGSVMDYMQVDPRVRIFMLCIILGLIGWTTIARMTRGQILSLREQEFMIATEATGIRVSRRIMKHLIPNVIPQIIVISTMELGSVILMEATLSFLGLGVKFPYASWGNIVNAVNDSYVLTNYWFVWIPAGCLILLTVLGFNFVGDGLRDAFDPKMKR
ncbi:MAG: ABC transporter permease [Eubacteriales bacterium]|nr:ABC transporter permease [Eubacteriales bacterium]